MMNILQELLAGKTPWLPNVGLKPTMMLHKGIDLPYFAACTLLDTDTGKAELTR